MKIAQRFIAGRFPNVLRDTFDNLNRFFPGSDVTITHRRNFLKCTVTGIGVGIGGLPTLSLGSQRKAPGSQSQLALEHVTAINRRRRVVINFDIISGNHRFGGRDPAKLVKWKFNFIDPERVQIDSVWWCWGGERTLIALAQ